MMCSCVQRWQIMMTLLTMFRLPVVDWLSWRKVTEWVNEWVRETQREGNREIHREGTAAGEPVQAACSGLAQLEEGEGQFLQDHHTLQQTGSALALKENIQMQLWLMCCCETLVLIDPAPSLLRFFSTNRRRGVGEVLGRARLHSSAHRSAPLLLWLHGNQAVKSDISWTTICTALFKLPRKEAIPANQ